MPDVDRLFAGSIPQLYEQYLVPLIFEPYAADLAARAARRQPGSLLEIAAGTGVVTRQLAQLLPAESRIVATDLNAAMLAEAQSRGTARPVEWGVADAMQLPFDDASFDMVVCEFGAMFFPDKAHAFAEARRVLRPGGLLLFNVWDAIEDNEFADVVTQSVAALYPDDPPLFLARTPHGYHDAERIRQDLAAGGFQADAQIHTVAARSRASDPRVPAIAYCHGTPLRNEIESRGPGALDTATDAASDALAACFGLGPVDGRIQALVVSIER